jgi:hypothetical protein
MARYSATKGDAFAKSTRNTVGQVGHGFLGDLFPFFLQHLPQSIQASEVSILDPVIDDFPHIFMGLQVTTPSGKVFEDLNPFLGQEILNYAASMSPITVMHENEIVSHHVPYRGEGFRFQVLDVFGRRPIRRDFESFVLPLAEMPPQTLTVGSTKSFPIGGTSSRRSAQILFGST